MRQDAGPSILEIEFSGWAQCRLATDPDGGFIRRGETGNAFAVGQEPDLDRLIRFQSDGTVTGSHCPKIGVFVTVSRTLETALQTLSTGVSVNEFVGAKVDLKGDPKFEGRNHFVSEDGEPVDPFELLIYTDSGLKLGRSVTAPPFN